MNYSIAELQSELQLIWRAHQRVGLQGKMCLYSVEGTRPWPTQKPGLKFWFGPDEIDAALQYFATEYKDGTLPCTPLLLNPIVHRPEMDGTFTPLGSGILWALALDIKNISDDKRARLESLSVAAGYTERGDDSRSGLKLLAFSDTVLPVEQSGGVAGCRELYELADIKNEEYRLSYILSGIRYLSNAGGYKAPALSALIGDAQPDAVIAAHTVELQTLRDALTCWDAYDRYASLYERFGNDVPNLQENLKFFNYCARDFELFDSIGPMSVKAKTKGDNGFEFLVHGLIPRGSIVLLAGTGGTGKSSIAHKLCCLAATDWRDDEQPLWLGQPVMKENSKGICVYFSGEDGPPIINARNEIFDPERRANRLMFQRMDFKDKKGNEISFADFLARLRTMPEVPLLVIDPARKYLTGDEDDAAVVSEFFEAIEKFAHEKNAAVIVVHHLSKGAKPQSARDVLDELRGSQVFIDRPRVVIGMFREGPKTIVGLGKCNIPPSLGMVVEERVFAHNPKTLELIQLPGAEGVRGVYTPPVEEDA